MDSPAWFACLAHARSFVTCVALVLPLAAARTSAQGAAPRDRGAAACVLHDPTASPDSSGSTVAALVCEALREAGAQVDIEPTPDRDGRVAYEVTIRPLGTVILLQVSLRLATGQVQRSETIQMTRIEETPIAARRLAEAMLHQTHVRENAKVDTLVAGEDTRRLERRAGHVMLSLGVLGFAAPAGDLVSGFGAFGRIQFETAAFSGSIEARLAGSGHSQGNTFLGGLAVGGRWFVLSGNLAPFLGGGLGIAWLAMDGEHDDHLRGSGFTPYAELGLELMRFYSCRMDVFLRFDVPTFELERPDGHNDRYWLPLSVMASYTFG
jgi:hypothetical protein